MKRSGRRDGLLFLFSSPFLQVFSVVCRTCVRVAIGVWYFSERVPADGRRWPPFLAVVFESLFSLFRPVRVALHLSLLLPFLSLPLPPPLSLSLQLDPDTLTQAVYKQHCPCLYPPYTIHRRPPTFITRLQAHFQHGEEEVRRGHPILSGDCEYHRGRAHGMYPFLYIYICLRVFICLCPSCLVCVRLVG